MIDIILAFLFGWMWGKKEEQKQRIKDEECPLNIMTEDGQSFGYLKNKEEDLR